MDVSTPQTRLSVLLRLRSALMQNKELPVSSQQAFQRTAVLLGKKIAKDACNDETLLNSNMDD